MDYKIHFHFFSLLLFLAVSSATRNHEPHSGAGAGIINDLCKVSRYPAHCEKSFPPPMPGATALQGIKSALDVSFLNLEAGRLMVQKILEDSASNANLSAAGKTCLEQLHYSGHRINQSAEDALPHGRKKDARAWMTAATVFQYDCWATLLKYVNATPLVNKTATFFNSSVISPSSDALAMLVNYDLYGEKTGSWARPKTEREGFWEPGSGQAGSGPTGGVPTGLKADATVCKGGKCDHKTVQDAVDAAPENAGPDKRFVILIKTGVYEETVRVPLEKKNVVFLGEGMGKTVITGSRNVGQPAMSTYNSATVAVAGDGFMASGLTIQNTAGSDAQQAVAFRSDSDHSIIENCEFIGNQDTLYAHSLRQFYKSCRIQGNIDFIFGFSAAFFEDCTILVAPRESKSNADKGESNAVTADGRMDPAQSTGFVFENCSIDGTEAYMAQYKSKPSVHQNYLGRPWKEFSRTVFIKCRLGALIKPEGWTQWSGDFALETLYYGEFENTGPGSDRKNRVKWSSQIPADRASSYSVGNFIQGDEWIPKSTR